MYDWPLFDENNQRISCFSTNEATKTPDTVSITVVQTAFYMYTLYLIKFYMYNEKKKNQK